MSAIERAIEPYISGMRGGYYYSFYIADAYFSAGNFWFKKDCRNALKNALRAIILDDSIIIHLLDSLA